MGQEAYRETVEKAGVISYDMILLDMQIPKLDGLQATSLIRVISDYRDTPILAMTANAFAEDKARCTEAGMNDFISKPYNPNELFSLLLKWLEKNSTPKGTPDETLPNKLL